MKRPDRFTAIIENRIFWRIYWRIRILSYKGRWYFIQIPSWWLFQKGREFCPRCHSYLKKHHCKKCDIYYWRGNSW